MGGDPLRETTPDTAAAYWFTRHRARSLTQNDMSAFRVWLENSAQNRSAFLHLQDVWSEMAELEDDPAFIELCGEDERALVTSKRRMAFAALAAGLVLAVTGGWAVTKTDVLTGLSWLQQPPTQEYRTAVGEQTSITLADGSVMMLDTNTVAHVRLTRRERFIELDRGQASFEVAKDKHRPFIVAAAGRTVRATGTKFDVRVEPGRFEVTLIEGRVRVQERSGAGDDVPLTDMRQGWRLAIAEDARWRMEPIDLVAETSWHDGMLVFQRDTLAEAVAEMNRYSARKIVFNGEAPSMPVIGMFRAGDIDGFVRVIEVNKLARVTARTDDIVELTAR